MVFIASYYMEGEAYDWFQTLETERLCTDCVEVICTLQDWLSILISEAPMEAPTENHL